MFKFSAVPLIEVICPVCAAQAPQVSLAVSDVVVLTCICGFSHTLPEALFAAMIARAERQLAESVSALRNHSRRQRTPQILNGRGYSDPGERREVMH